jgi:hypothetical protein
MVPERPHLSLVSGPFVSAGCVARTTRRNRAVALVLGLVVVAALVMLALPIRSLGGSTLAQASPQPGQEYLVKQGDTLASIARRADPAHAGWMADRLAAQTGTTVVVPGEHIVIP